MEVCGRSGRSSKASDVPMRIRRRQSDARWRANVASCFETLKNIIPVNKRASKRQISKAYILQETSKHINFLEGILCTLIEEKANIDGAREDGCFNQFETVKEDFILNQQLKLAALNNERKYKRNKYKIYISDHLAYANDQRPGHGALNRRRATKPRGGACSCNPGPQHLVHQGLETPVNPRGRGKVLKEQPTVRIYVRPPKRMKIGTLTCKSELPEGGENPLIIAEKPTPPPSAMPSPPPTVPHPILPKGPCRRKQRVPRKRKIASETKKVDSKKKKMTSINPPITKGGGATVVGGGGGVLSYQLIPNHAHPNTAPNVVPVVVGPAGQGPRQGPGTGAVFPGTHDHWDGGGLLELQTATPTPAAANLPPSLPALQVTPSKSITYTGAESYSTPARPNQPVVPQGPLSPLQEEPFPTTPLTTVLHSTPVKSPCQGQTRAGGGFTPVSLPKAWMTTPSGQSPRTPDNMNTPICQHSWNEPKRLQCDEDMSSEDEDTKKGPKTPQQSQSLHHRESKLSQGPGRRCPNSGADEKSKAKCAPKRHENMKCRRSLNMSLDSPADTKASPEFTSFCSTEACIQDFDRYYEQLKDSRLNSPDDETAANMSPVWRLVEEVTCLNSTGPDRHNLCTTLEYSQKPDQQLDDQEMDEDINPFLSGRLDVNATDEYVPLEPKYFEDSIDAAERDVWQVVPNAPPQSNWTDCLDTQLVPDKPRVRLVKTEPAPQVGDHRRSGWDEGPENQLVPEQLITSEGSESFRADVLRFIRRELFGQQGGLEAEPADVISQAEVNKILEQLGEQQGAGGKDPHYRGPSGGQQQPPYSYNGEDGLVLWDMSPDTDNPWSQESAW